MSQYLQDSVKKKLIKEYNAYKNDTKHNHGFSLRPLIKEETDPRWGLEWTAKIFCTDEIFMGSKFVLKITLCNSYPAVAPTLKFMEPQPFHPNVLRGPGKGTLCYTLLSSDWAKNSTMTIPALVTNIAGFLANPNFPTGYNQEPKVFFMRNKEEYYAEVKRLSRIKT